MRKIAVWRSCVFGLALAVLNSGTARAQGEAVFPHAAAVQDDVAAGPSWSEYQEVLERLEIAERHIATLSQQAGNGPSELLPAQPFTYVHADGNPPVPATEQRLTAIESHLNHESPGPRFPTARLSGFMHLDAGNFDQDAVSMATLGDIQNGVGFRRARLQALGSVTEFTNYSIEMDFATAGRPSFMDVWGEQTGVPFLGNVRIGHFRQPFSMDAATSVRQLEFLERSLPFQAFVPFRRVGIMAYDVSDSQRTSWAYGIYRTGGFNNAPLGDTRFATDIGDGGGTSFSGRATHLLWYDEFSDGRYLLHIGGSYNYSRITGGTEHGNSYQARVIPEFFVGDPDGAGLTAAGVPFFADTGRLLADQYHLYGVELAGQFGSAHFQAEYMSTQVDQIGAPSANFDGAYLQVGYFLTGEHRTYNRTVGAFDRVVPFTEFFSLGRKSVVCGWGAWEVVGRWSYVDLNDANAAPVLVAAGPPPTPNPGRLHDTTLGLNWFWNSYTKVQFNWIHAFLDNRALGDSDTDIYAARFEVAF